MTVSLMHPPASLLTLPIEVLDTHILARLIPSDIAAVSCVCRSLRRLALRRRTFHLSRLSSERFLLDADFREAVCEHIPRRQLAVDLRLKASAFSTHYAKRYGFNVAVRDISCLAGVHTLLLECCDSLTDVSPLNISASGASSLAVAPSISPALRQRIHCVDLSGCHMLVDVTPLAGVHTVFLRNCGRLEEVSALGTAHVVDVSGCLRVRDVSALGRMHSLNISGTNVADVSALGHVHTLIAARCDRIVDVSALWGVRVLDLSRCVGVADVSALGEVHTLDLRYCLRVSDVSALGGVRKLYLEGTCVTGVSSPAPVRELGLGVRGNVRHVVVGGRVQTFPDDLPVTPCETLTSE